MITLVNTSCSLMNFELFGLLGAFFQVIKSKKPLKVYIFTLNYTLKTKKHQKIKKRWKIFFESSFTFGAFKLFFPTQKFACLQIGT